MKPDSIQIKAPITGWHDATEEQAKRFAADRYHRMVGRYRLEYLNQCMLRGISFTEEELINEWNRIRWE